MALMYPGQSRRRSMTPQNKVANRRRQQAAPQPDQVSPNNTQRPRQTAMPYMGGNQATAGAGWKPGPATWAIPNKSNASIPAPQLPGKMPVGTHGAGGVVNTTSPGVPSTPQPPPTAPTPTKMPQPTTPPVDNTGAGLPLDAEYEAVRRQLDAELAMTLSQLGVAKALIPQQVEQFRQRAFTDQGFTHRDINESANARGIYHSGIRPDDINEANIGYERGWQDEQNRATQQLGDLANQEAIARSNYQRQLQESMMEYAKWLYENQPPTVGGEVVPPGQEQGGGSGGPSKGAGSGGGGSNPTPGAPSGKPGTKVPVTNTPGVGGTVKVPSGVSKPGGGYTGNKKKYTPPNRQSQKKEEEKNKNKGKGKN